MYIKTQMIKKINEVYYRHLQDTNLRPLILTENFKIDLDYNLHKTFFVNKSDIMPNYHSLLVDLSNYIFNINITPQTDEYKNLLKTVVIDSTKVKNCLSDSTPITQEVAGILLNCTKHSCLVGGCVRDAILGLVPKDFDFCTNEPYDNLEKMFENAGFKVQEEGKEFLVMIVSKKGEQFEIANFRKDGTYVDGRRPESVDVGTIKDDAQRRDFTINALYYNLDTNLVEDPNGTGIEDIHNTILRFVGKPADRLNEDNLRGWRFWRFLNKLEGFKANPKDLKAVRQHWDKIYNNSNPQRVLNEVAKMLNL